MRLYTFYDHVPAHDNVSELRMLQLWRRHHTAFGFEPFVLQEWHAQLHERYGQFLAAVEKLPSINPKMYDRACYLRWLAMASTGEPWGIMMDYDTLLTPTQLKDLDPLLEVEQKDLLHVYQNTTPCIVTGNPKAFERACIWFASFAHSGEKHLSDMIVLEKVAQAEPDAYVRSDFAKCYGEDGWKTAPAIHFSNACMTPAGKTPRFAWMPKLLEERGYTPPPPF
jgi:hypothetical protein